MRSIRCSEKFRRNYRSLSPPLAALVDQEVDTLRRQIASQPDLWSRGYDRVEGVGRNDILEMKIAGANRLVMHNGSHAVTLLLVGSHETTDRARRININNSIAQSGPLPNAMTRKRFPPAARGRRVTNDPVELSPEWNFTLADDQLAVAERILRSVEEDLLNNFGSAHLIQGGPGTGKTVVLLWLLRNLAAAVPDTSETWEVGLRASDELITHLEDSMRWDLDPVRVGDDPERFQVLLVDDPASLGEMRNAYGLTKSALNTAVVVGLDPFQLAHGISDAGMFDLIRNCSVQRYYLQECYRQKEEVGRLTAELDQRIINSPTDSSRRAVLTKQLPPPIFVNEGGRIRTYDELPTEGWQTTIDWLGDHRYHLWHHSPAVLLAVDGPGLLSDSWRSQLEEAIGVACIREVQLADAEHVKGLEFQHALVVLRSSTYQSLQHGARGSELAEANALRLMRIPFTRARDSLTLFVVP